MFWSDFLDMEGCPSRLFDAERLSVRIAITEYLKTSQILLVFESGRLSPSCKRS